MRFIFPVLMMVFLFSCDFSFRKNDARIKALNAMQQTDVDFARMAEDNGFRKAFLEYMEEDAVLLRDNHMPIIGADAVQYISSINDSSFNISWEPQGGDIAEAGDMGYTFGLYQLKTETEEQRGTYITIWRKQKDGKWKYVLDAGTQGLEVPGENKE
jgi:ketosteroid isomerase-like protein